MSRPPTGKKPLSTLDRKTPSNPRFAHIKSTINTGPASLTNATERMKKQQKYAPQKGEKFKRIRPDRFVLLVNEDRDALEASYAMDFQPITAGLNSSMDSNDDALFADMRVGAAAIPARGTTVRPHRVPPLGSGATTSSGSSSTTTTTKTVSSSLPPTTSAASTYRFVNVIAGEGQLQPDGCDSQYLLSSGLNPQRAPHRTRGGFPGGGGGEGDGGDNDDAASMVSGMSRFSTSSTIRSGPVNGILTGDYEVEEGAPPRRKGRGAGSTYAHTLSESMGGDATSRSLMSSRTGSVTSRMDSFLDTARSFDTTAIHETQRYLLLDVRTPEEYEVCHLQGAISYPSSMLSRATNFFTPDIYAFRNKEERLIIIYDNDEILARQTATVFFEKGVDNIVLLSGGLKAMIEEYPEMVEGTVPAELAPPPPPPTKRVFASSLPKSERAATADGSTSRSFSRDSSRLHSSRNTSRAGSGLSTSRLSTASSARNTSGGRGSSGGQGSSSTSSLGGGDEAGFSGRLSTYTRLPAVRSQSASVQRGGLGGSDNDSFDDEGGSGGGGVSTSRDGSMDSQGNYIAKNPRLEASAFVASSRVGHERAFR